MHHVLQNIGLQESPLKQFVGKQFFQYPVDSRNTDTIGDQTQYIIASLL